MLTGIIGKKIGMTQIFDAQQRVVPVTVIGISGWYVTQVKNEETDGYNAVQVGKLRKRYESIPFDNAFLTKKSKYFEHVKEIRLESASAQEITPGKQLSAADLALDEGTVVSVTGISRGLGFCGVVKRYKFRGGPQSHGSKFHNRPGSISHMRTQGEVIKGKRLPGHHGTDTVTVSGLKIVKFDKEGGYLFVKGAVPGKSNTVISVYRQG